MTGVFDKWLTWTQGCPDIWWFVSVLSILAQKEPQTFNTWIQQHETRLQTYESICTWAHGNLRDISGTAQSSRSAWGEGLRIPQQFIMCFVQMDPHVRWICYPQYLSHPVTRKRDATVRVATTATNFSQISANFWRIFARPRLQKGQCQQRR